MEPLFSHWGEHIGLLMGGGFAMSAIAHGVNTFPTPENKYGAWLLGLIQYIVGQRVAAKNTLQGMDTVATGIPKKDEK